MYLLCLLVDSHLMLMFVLIVAHNHEVPAVSFLEWHPYSITSSPSVHGSSQTVVFHVKAAGSWTKEVINEAKLGNALKVRVDGFYGVNNGICEQLSSNKDGVILVGGGIG